MKLRYAQEVFARYGPETVLLVESPDDGTIHEVEGLADDTVFEGDKRLPGLVFQLGPQRVQRWEYKTTSKTGPAVGVEEASKPTPPGDEWELVSASVTGSTFFYFWRRPWLANRERCPNCGRTLAEANDEAIHNTGECGCAYSRTLCWRRWNGDVCCLESPYAPG